MYQNNSNKISSKECAFIATTGCGLFGTIIGGTIGGVASYLAGYSAWMGIVTGLGPGCIFGCAISLIVPLTAALCSNSDQQHQQDGNATDTTPILSP